MKKKFKYALDKLKNTWRVHGREAGLFFGVFLTGIIGFEAGLVEGQSMVSKPLVIDVPAAPSMAFVSDQEAFAVAGVGTKSTDSAVTPSKAAADGNSDQNCKFVGSKNSDKYHLPTCSFAKRIKPENRVCFASEDEAKAKGYAAGCLK